MVHRGCLYANNTNTLKEYCYWLALNKPGIKFGLIITCSVEATRNIRVLSSIKYDFLISVNTFKSLIYDERPCYFSQFLCFISAIAAVYLIFLSPLHVSLVNLISFKRDKFFLEYKT